jgi:hypothetical protein
MIDWWNLSCNSNADAVELLKKNPDKIVWFSLSFYEHGSGGTAETQPDKIDWYNLSINPSIFEIDYEALKNRTAVQGGTGYGREFAEIIMRLLDMGIDIET